MQQAPLILASGSPRRKRLLEQAGITFSVLAPKASEETGPGMDPEQAAMELAARKAAAVAVDHPESWVLGADTMVVLGKDILGKPLDEDDAKRMITLLSGRTHRVITGYCLQCLARGRTITEAVTTRVTFRKLFPGEIEWYVSTGKAMDKAGAYGIQGPGAFMVKRLEGSYTNVVGLPLGEVVERLIAEGVLARK
ncbi:MAG: septum formation protein Maf [Deltaproteobacteria bacterium]|nr:septum formation protein Maf [Deltaproteobacteria bacterium]